MKTIVAIVAVSTATALAATAFVPPATFTHAPPLSQRVLSMSSPSEGGESKSSSSSTTMQSDDDFEGVNMIRLMGLKRLKKMARRHRRELNDRIRNLEVVQDGDDWVEATPEQVQDMKKAAESAEE